MAQPPIDLYYARVCGLCTKAFDFLRERGVTFTAHAIEWDDRKQQFVDSENTRRMYERCGGPIDFVPQLFIGSRHIKGWRELEPMIKSGAIDKIIPRAGRRR